MDSPTIYKPPGSVSLAESKRETQIRLGIQGAPGVGKTWAALTFPNPVVANFDRGLISHEGRSDVIEVPFWNPSFVDNILKDTQRQGRAPNRMDAWRKWLEEEAPRLLEEQTLVIDSNRQIQNAFHTQYAVNGPPITKSGKDNKFHEWTEKNKYFAELGSLYKAIRCDVVYICHEVDDVNAEGELNGRVKPMLSGESGRSIASDFTDWYRAIAIENPLSFERREVLLSKGWCSSAALLNEWIAESSTQTLYLWQTQSDSICNCKTSLTGAPKYVLASYATFNKYKRK